MKITLLTVGTRGDVQPYLALSVGLQKAGHQVKIATSPNFEALIRSYGVDFAPVQFNPQEILQHPSLQKLLKSRNLVRQLRAFRQIFGDGIPLLFNDFWQACQGAEGIVYTITGHGGYDIAEKMQIPLVMASLQPFFPTRQFPTFFFPPVTFLGGGYNWLSHKIVERALWFNFGQYVNQWRREKLGLQPMVSFGDMFRRLDQAGVPWLLGYSRHILPKPEDWSDNFKTTGYWFLPRPADWKPDPALMRFLEAGPSPVYIGYGSMKDNNPEHLTQLALKALADTGQRGILLSGWGGLKARDLPATVYQVEAVAHDWLFPQTAVAVHHGGAGTTGASLMAGKPTVITPFAFDQYSWQNVVCDLGVGPHAPSIRRLTPQGLAEAIATAVQDQSMRTKAQELGTKIQAEEGVGSAVQIIEAYFRK